jgi:hypothetical protein
MNKKYSFAVLRYYHDILSGEFLNVGVVLYISDLQYLNFTYTHRYGRLSKTFLDVDGEHFKRMLRKIYSRVFEISQNLKNPGFFDEKIKSLRQLTSMVLPIDDSSLQFSNEGFGVTDNPDKAMEYLFDRYVNKYVEKQPKFSRTDDDVWRIFKKPLEEKKIINYLRPHKIISKNYEYNFAYSWKNEVWHLNEAVSFDLIEPQHIVEKANTWLGRVTTLSDTSDKFKLNLLLGKPHDEKHMKAFIKAENIMNKMPCDHEFINENEAEEFASELQKEIKKDQAKG